MGLEKDVKAGWNDLKGFLKNSKKRVSRLRNALSSSPGNLTPRGGWTTKLLVSAVLFYFGLNYAQSDFDNKKENKNKTEQTDPNYNIKKIPLSHSLYPQLVSYATDIAAIPNGNIYASSITGWVSVIDPLTNKVIGDITPENIQGMPIGFGLDDIEAESGGQFIYVANGVNNKLHKIDVNTYSVVKTFNVGKITEMARKPDQRLIYFSEESNTSIKILDVVSDSLTSKDIGFAPRDMVFNAAGDRIYVYGENRVKIMDPSLTQTYDEITVSPSFQQDMVITPDNQFMFISDKSNYLYKIDFFTNNAIGLLSDDWLYGLAVDKEGKYLYAVNQSDKTIEKIDIASSTTTKNVVETISINDAIALENITFGPFNEDLYVTA